MYPNSSANHPAHSQLWQQEDGNDQGRHSASEPGAYSSAPPPPPPQAQRGPQTGYLREDPVRDERYGSREDAYRYPPREDDYRSQALPPPLGLAPGGPPQHPGPPILPQVSHLGPDPHAMGAQDLYRGQQDYPRMTHSHNPHNFVQPAPRQRTAIACRYCRRRKIRCSGFESSADGRCSNCQRFNQECIFTPVSSQTQAFVPAHTHYPELRQNSGGRGGARQGYPPRNVQLFGAFGEPIPTSSLSLGSAVDYSVPQYGGRGPSPTPHQGPHQPPYEQLSYDPNQRPGLDGSAPVLPPLPRRSSQGDPVQWNRIDQASSPPILPPPHNAASATTYGESAPSTFYPPGSQNRRTSPPAFVGGDRPSSISPHPVVHPPMWPEPPRPGSTGPAGPKLHPMQLSNIIDQSTPQQRSAHDNEMLNQLKRGL